MKRILSILTFALAMAFSSAQVPPQKMTYQIVVRDNNNELLANQPVGVKISILKSSPYGVPVYEETHTATTNANGLLGIVVGTGTPAPGTALSDVVWSADDYYLKSEVDPHGGIAYTIVGTQQLVTVPYAFYSGSADYKRLENRPPDGSHTGDLLYWDASDSSWHVVPVGAAGQVLTLNPNGVPQWYSNVLNQNAPPTIVTDTIMDVTGYTMSVKATIVNSGSTGIIASGVCWSSTNPSPSIGNNYTADGSSVGSFYSQVSGLNSNTVYYVCAYATNSVGTSYGNVLTVKTPTHCGTVTDIDGNTYNTVYIGRQCWMKENLRTKTYADGIKISPATNVSQSIGADDAHSTNPNSCYYYVNNDPSTFTERGLQYTWDAVMKGAGSSSGNPSGILGVCPYGWHVPSSAEWCELENLLNPGIDVNCTNHNWRGTMAKMLSSPKLWTSNSTNSFFPGYWTKDAIDFNTTGFSMIPTGYWYYNGSSCCYTCSIIPNSSHYHYGYYHSGIDSYAFFWTSVSGNYRQFSYSETGCYFGSGQSSSSAMSVRCLKDYN